MGYPVTGRFGPRALVSQLLLLNVTRRAKTPPVCVQYICSLTVKSQNQALPQRETDIDHDIFSYQTAIFPILCKLKGELTNPSKYLKTTDTLSSSCLDSQSYGQGQ